jgi:tetratricopeptide (TPR) repeat protein
MPDARQQLEHGLKHQTGGRLTEALDCFRLAAGAAADDAALRADALRRQAIVHHMRAEWEAALDAAARAADVARGAGLADHGAEALNVTALVHQARGDFVRAAALYEQILAGTGNDRVRGAALQNLGSIAAQQGDFETARLQFRASHQCFHRVGYLRGEAVVLINFGAAAVDHRNFAVAADLLRQAVHAAKRLGDAELAFLASKNYAEALAGLREFATAEQLTRAALDHFTDTGNAWRRVECLRLLGDLRRDQLDAGAAEEHYRTALALAEQIGAAAEVSRLRERVVAMPGAAADGADMPTATAENSRG